jgi:uracil-DNA glycosylase family 4
MIGFFKKSEISKKTRSQTKETSCHSCGLVADSIHPKMEPYGNFRKGIFILGSAPNEIEDAKNKLWLGQTGRSLKKALSDLGIDLYEDCLSLNSVNCKIPEGQEPSGIQINCCRDGQVLRTIERHKPKLIILFGVSAVVSFIGHRWKKNLGGIAKWRGWTIPDRDYKTWVCPMFHPNYVFSSGQKAIETIWNQDLKRAIKKLNEPLPEYVKPNIVFTSHLDFLYEIKEGSMTAFDYETTGIKPHALGHKIVCAGVAINSNDVYAFEMPSRRKKRQAFVDYLENKKIKKVASNMKYEDHWSKVRLRARVRGWFHDTMLAAHELDNRPGITSLKFQAYVLLGVIDYDSDVNSYFKTKEKGGNAINNIMKLANSRKGMKLLLEYVALDAIYEYRVAQIQISQMEPCPF